MNNMKSKKVSVLTTLSLFLVAFLSLAMFTVIGNQGTVFSRADDLEEAFRTAIKDEVETTITCKVGETMAPIVYPKTLAGYVSSATSADTSIATIAIGSFTGDVRPNCLRCVPLNINCKKVGTTKFSIESMEPIALGQEENGEEVQHLDSRVVGTATVKVNVVSQSSIATHSVLGEKFKFLKGNFIQSGTVFRDGFTVEMYYADQIQDNNSIFCVWHNVGVWPYDESDADLTAIDPQHEYRYTKDGEIDDNGLLYLLNVDIPSLTGVVSGHLNEVNYWVRQTAILGYLHRTNNKRLTGPFSHNQTVVAELNVNELSRDELTALNKSTDLSIFPNLDNNAVSIYHGVALANEKLGTNGDNTVVGKLINDAIKYKNSVNENNGELSLNFSEFTLTEDGKSYQSEISISTVPTPYDSSLNNYYYLVPKIENTEIYNKNNEKLELIEANFNGEDYYSFDPISGNSGRTIYIRIPADQIKDDMTSYHIYARGKVNVLNGHYYIDNLFPTHKFSGKLQKVITVSGQSRDVKGESILLIKVQDTGMNVVQTIYFVGLIVLLCGIGIVYANAKPVENKQ